MVLTISVIRLAFLTGSCKVSLRSTSDLKLMKSFSFAFINSFNAEALCFFEKESGSSPSGSRITFTFNPSSSTKQAGLGLGYQHDLGKVFCEYLKGSKSAKSIMGYSVGGVFNIGGMWGNFNGYNLFARADYYDPNANVNNDENKKTYYGATYDWTKDLKLALDIQNSQTGNGAVTSIVSFNTSIVM